jgi:YD repeat-containing protein
MGRDALTDAAGNLAVDEDGRHYDYDERNRLVEVRAANDATVLAHYAYDAFGRRVAAKIGDTERHYHYDGEAVIEEYAVTGGTETGPVRYHTNGAQYIDERVASFEVQADQTVVPTYYHTWRQLLCGGHRQCRWLGHHPARVFADR